jgi:cobalt transporter subunit CbtB
MTQTTAPKAVAAPRALAGAHLPQILAAGLLGFFIVLGVGFSPMAAVHNASHDVRHSFAFPCH